MILILGLRFVPPGFELALEIQAEELKLSTAQAVGKLQM